MSRDRTFRRFRWVDIAGVQQDKLVEKLEPSRLAQSAPRSKWLVEVMDPAQHLVAFMAAHGGVDVVYTGRGGDPAFILEAEGLRAAYITAEDGARHIRGVGSARGYFPLDCCRGCRSGYLLRADALRAKRGSCPGKPGRLTVGESVQRRPEQR